MSTIMQYIRYLGILIILAIPMGNYIKKVMNDEKTFSSKIVGPCEKLVYKVLRIDKDEQMTWKQYAISAVVFSAIGFIVLSPIPIVRLIQVRLS